MNPELTDHEISELHREALDIYNLYLKLDATHRVDIPSHLIKEIEQSKAIV